MSATLAALVGQSDCNYSLVLVDNGSTDNSAAISEQFALQNPHLTTHRLHEPTKGTGVASDTGFRFAIQNGADWIARTDADCVPDADWIRNLKRAFIDDELEFVAGRILPRLDEAPLTLAGRVTLMTMLWIVETYGKLHRRGPQFLYPYFLVAGNNLAITASLYERSGGFPRVALEDLNEDTVLAETVRTITSRAAKRHDVIVRNSARRVRAYGILNTLRWYRNRGYHPDVVDVR